MSWEYYLVGASLIVLLGGGLAFVLALAYVLFFKGRARTPNAAARSIIAEAATILAPPPAQSPVSDLSDVSSAAWAKFMADTKSTMIDMGVERLRSDFREALGPKGKGGDAARPPAAPPA